MNKDKFSVEKYVTVHFVSFCPLNVWNELCNWCNKTCAI